MVNEFCWNLGTICWWISRITKVFPGWVVWSIISKKKDFVLLGIRLLNPSKFGRCFLFQNGNNDKKWHIKSILGWGKKCSKFPFWKSSTETWNSLPEANFFREEWDVLSFPWRQKNVKSASKLFKKVRFHLLLTGFVLIQTNPNKKVVEYHSDSQNKVQIRTKCQS